MGVPPPLMSPPPWALVAPKPPALSPSRPRYDPLRTLRERFPEITLIVDAGIGKPSDAVQAMEMGMDGVLLNSAVALAGHPARIAKAFRQAIEAGRTAYEAGTMSPRNLAAPSTPTLGTPFWHQENPH